MTSYCIFNSIELSYCDSTPAADERNPLPRDREHVPRPTHTAAFATPGINVTSLPNSTRGDSREVASRKWQITANFAFGRFCTARTLFRTPLFTFLLIFVFRLFAVWF